MHFALLVILMFTWLAIVKVVQCEFDWYLCNGNFSSTKHGIIVRDMYSSMEERPGKFNTYKQYFQRYIDGLEVFNTYLNDEESEESCNQADVISITNDDLGSYLRFPCNGAGEIFKRTYLNITCKANTTMEDMSHTTNFTTKFVCKTYRAESGIVVHPVAANVLLGETVEFNCTTFAVEDFHIVWTFKNGSKVDKNHARYDISQNNSCCENVTSVLRIRDVLPSDINEEFACVLIINRDFSEKSSRFALLQKSITRETENFELGIIIALSLFIITTIVAIVTHIYRIELLLLFKDNFAALETEGLYDLFICYNSEDSEIFVANFILPNLENDYGYKCFVMDRNSSGGDWIPEIVSSKIKESKRFLLIMSKKVTSDPTCIWACEVALEHAINGKKLKQLISIYPRDQKKELFDEMAQVDSLKLMCSSSKKVQKVDPKEVDAKNVARFWRKVRLHLPPIREANSTIFLGPKNIESVLPS